MKMKIILLVSIITVVFAQSSLAIQDRPYRTPTSALLGMDNEKTKMVREGGATMRGDNQESYKVPELFDEEKIVMKPRKRKIEQQVWEDFSYPTPKFVTD